MRSILLVSSRSSDHFATACASAADALALDLGAAGDGAREAVPSFVAAARGRGKFCLVKIRALDSGLADSDLDAVMPARPDGVILPDACGGRDVQHLGAKLAVREAEYGLPDGYARILALAADSPAAIFELGSFVRATRRLIGLGRDEQRLAERLRIDRGPERPATLDLARALTVFAAAAAQAPAFDCAEQGAGATFAEACARAKRDGFAGKFALDAAQVEEINMTFARERRD